MAHLLVNDYNKVLYSDNGTFTDHSMSMKNWTSDTMGTVLTLDEDYIYVGAPHTFSTRFILIDAANDVSANLTVEYFVKNTTWSEVKNFADETKVGAATLGKTGFISWQLPDDWGRSQVDGLPELTSTSSCAVNKEGYFWIRIKSSATLNIATAIKWFGTIWTNHQFLKLRWYEVDTERYLPEGKTDWYEVIEMSTKDVVRDLNISQIADYELQVKDISEMADLTALKTLVNILIPLRHIESLRIMKEEFDEMYKKELKVRFKGIDQNKNEKLENSEKTNILNSRIFRT